MSNDAALTEWWDELSPEQQEQWKGLPTLHGIPHELAVPLYERGLHPTPLVLPVDLRQADVRPASWAATNRLADFLADKRGD